MKFHSFVIAIFAVCFCVLLEKTFAQFQPLYLTTSKSFLLPNDTFVNFYCRVQSNFTNLNKDKWMDFYVKGKLAGAQIFNRSSKFFFTQIKKF